MPDIPDTGHTSRTKGRAATEGVIPGRFALSVGAPALPCPNGWRWAALSEIAQLESGHTPSRKHPEYWNEGIPWIGIKDAVDNHGRTIQDTYQNVSQLGLANSSARLLPKGTVCLSRTASVGFVVVMGRTMSTSQDFVNWVCGPQLEPLYLKYCLLAERDSLLRFASGTTHQTIYYPEAKAFHVLLPPIEEQRAILSVLCPLDEKINLNRQTNETLEALTRALFKSWFIDFDNAGSVDADSIPVGWRYGVLEELQADRPNAITAGPFGSKLVSLDYVETGVPVIRGCNLGGQPGEWFTEDNFVYVSPEKVQRDLTSCLAWPGDVLFTQRGTLGQVGLIPEDANHDHYVVSQSQMKMTCAPGVPPEFVVLAFKRPETLAYIEANGVASGVPHINLGFLRRFPIIIPPSSVLKEFGEAVRPLHLLMRHNVVESRALTATRDTLLPRLLSGELRVRDAERVVGGGLLNNEAYSI